MKYEAEIKNICGDDWKTVNDAEREGGYGVAMVIAYMRGTKPSLGEFSRHLGVNADELSKPFTRLMRNGVMGRNATWDVSNDTTLLGRNGDDEAHRLWSFVAALSSGFLGNKN